jgi:hypothetical protein
MKDNRSLEQKIKAVVRESHEKRNSEIRMKMSNVGRPTDNVKDNSSKLAKQGEIKTKIIDEDSEYDMARNELETAKRAIDRLKTKMGKGEGELEAWVQSKITKASDYLDTVADYIESGSVKEEAIEEDAVASVSTKDTAKEQPEGKKKPNNKELQEPGTIKGGKTEVDTEPTTDDRDDEGKKLDDKSKIATRAANAQAGVKEETMNTKNFGLPDDLIATVAEALKGNQKNIDKNHNGKIDKEDFKILQGKKAEKIKAYRADRDKHGEMEEELKGNQGKLDKNHNGKLDKQDFKMLRGKKMEEEAEELDERDAGNKTKKDAAVAAVGAKNKDSQYLDRMNPAVADKIRGREKMSGVDRKQYKEEVEELDELSKGAMKSYVKQVDKKGEGDKRSDGLGMASKKIAKQETDRTLQRAVNKIGNTPMNQTKASDGHKYDASREELKGRGIHNFAGRRTKYEETDPGFSEAELAHINAILESDDYNYANSKDHKPLSNWPKVHAAIHNDYSDSGGGGTEGEKTELGKTPIHPKYHAAHDEAEANPKKMKKAINVHYGHDVSRDD